MASALLRGIAIAAGAGLAMGFGSAIERRRSQSRGPRHAPANLEPLIQRLERIEARITLAESRPAPEPAPALSDDVAAVRSSIARLDQRLAAQAREIELLQIRAVEAEHLAEAEIRITERRFKEVSASLPAEIEAIVAPRVEDLRQRLHSELKESVAGALLGFEESLDRRVSSRIAALEQKLLDQSASLDDLSRRSSQADTHLQGLVRAVERLCEQRAPEPAPPPAAAPAPEPAPTFFDLPVENHLTQPEPLAQSPMAVGAAAAAESVAFRPRTVRADDFPSRPRVPLAHVMIAAAVAFIGTRFLR